MKILEKRLGNGCSKTAYTIKDFPKQVALVFSYVDDRHDFAWLKAEHQVLSKIRKLGVPTLPARLQRVFNPHHPDGPREQWVMIVPRMIANIKQVGTAPMTSFEQWKSYLKVYQRLSRKGVLIGDLQMLFDKRRVLVSDPLSVHVFDEASQDIVYTRRNYQMQIDFI